MKKEAEPSSPCLPALSPGHERWLEAAANGAQLAEQQRGPHASEAKRVNFTEGHRHAPVKPAELVNVDSVTGALSTICCQQRCLAAWLVEDALVFRREIAKRNEAERLSYLLYILTLSPKSALGYHSYKLQTAQRTFSVCRRALLAILGVSSGKLDHASHLEKLGLHSAPPHGNVDRREDKLSALCESWWRLYIAEYCDQISAKKVLTPSSETFHDEYVVGC